MLKKEDFKNPIDWVIYQVNGKRKTENKIKEDYTLQNAKYPLKFYTHNGNGRCNVQYGKIHICTCDENEAEKVQNYFDENFNGKNIKTIANTLKSEHNHRIKKGKRGRKSKTYKENPVRFYERKNGRFQVIVNNKGKTHTICHCNKDQIEPIKKDYEMIKNKKSLDEIKSIMKEKYNEVKNETPQPIQSPKKRGLIGYRESRLQFDEKSTGRVQVRVRDNGRYETLCSCGVSQVGDVQSKYNDLKNVHDLEEIKDILKEEFNLKITGRKVKDKLPSSARNHQIVIDENGAVYKDGKFLFANDTMYDWINSLISVNVKK